MVLCAFSWPWAFYLEAMLMAPLALACAVIPPESATAVPNASDYGTSLGRGACVAATTAASSKEYLGVDRKSLGAGLRAGAGVEQGEGTRSPELTAVSLPSLPSSSAASPTRGSLRSRRRQPDLEKHPSSTSSLLGLWGSEEGEAEEGVGVDAEAAVDWRKHATAAEFGNGNGTCLVMSPSRVASRVFEGPEGQEEEEGGGVGWAVGQPAVASLGSLNSGGPVVTVSSTTSPFDERARDAAAESVLARDVLKIADRCVFCLVVLGGAATAAVSAGMSTFGTGFVTSLEFLSSETAAAATFGGVICVAGLAGTPAGGALIDASDPEGRLGDDKKLALVLRQAASLMCGATGELGAWRRLGRL